MNLSQEKNEIIGFLNFLKRIIFHLHYLKFSYPRTAVQLRSRQLLHVTYKLFFTSVLLQV